MQKKTEDVSLNKRDLNRNSSAVRDCLILFWEFFKIGSFTIGGGAVMIPLIQRMATVDKKWLTEEEMLDCIALGQSLPGVIAVNMATFIGHKQRSIIGAVIATIGVILPAFIAIIIVMAALDVIGDSDVVDGAFMGVKAAVCGIIAVTAVQLLRQMSQQSDRTNKQKNSLKNSGKAIFNVIMAAGSLLAVGFFGVTAILVILIGIVIGILFNCFVLERNKHKNLQDKEARS